MTSGLTLNLINTDETQTGWGRGSTWPRVKLFFEFRCQGAFQRQRGGTAGAGCSGVGGEWGGEKKTTEEILCLCATY